MEKWKILNIKIELAEAMLPEGTHFILDHDKDYTPVLYLSIKGQCSEEARGIDSIDEYFSDWYKLEFRTKENSAVRVLTGRLFQ